MWVQLLTDQKILLLKVKQLTTDSSKPIKLSNSDLTLTLKNTQEDSPDSKANQVTNTITKTSKWKNPKYVKFRDFQFDQADVLQARPTSSTAPRRTNGNDSYCYLHYNINLSISSGTDEVQTPEQNSEEKNDSCYDQEWYLVRFVGVLLFFLDAVLYSLFSTIIGLGEHNVEYETKISQRFLNFIVDVEIVVEIDTYFIGQGKSSLVCGPIDVLYNIKFTTPSATYRKLSQQLKMVLLFFFSFWMTEW